MVTAVAEARLLGGSGGSINDDSSAPNSGAILDPLFVGQPAAAAAAAVDPLLLSNSASNDSRHIRRADAVVARSRSGIIGTSGSPTTSTNNNKHGRRPRRWITSVFFAFLIAALTASIVQVIYFHNNNNHGLLLPSFATAVSRHLPEWKLSSGNSTVMASGARGDKHNLSSATKDSLSAESGGTGSNRKDDGTTVANNNPLLKLFESAGVNVGAELTEADRTQLLPSLYENMVRMYGVDERAPVVAGVDTCAAYRDRVPLERRYTAVAGMFNTGTNAMEFHLRRNIKIGAAKASLWQVPWGKHRMPAVTRLVHVAVGMEKVQQEDALPVVMVRDPYSWMQSMCKNAYAADWYRTKQHCPNLVPTALDLEKFGKLLQHSNNQFNVSVYFDKNQIIGWDSLVHLYNDYYRQYLFDANYPRLLVRFEDMLLHAPAIVKKIADCVGLDTADRFTYQIDSAKKHGSHTNFVKAVLKSGDVYARLKSFTADDLEYAAKHLDADLMSAMHYSIPTTPLLPPEEAKQGNK